MSKGLHHRGSYQARAAAVVQAAYRNSATVCWRCGKTLAQHRNHRTGRVVSWTAGHVTDSDPNSLLKPEASTCNFSAGARLGNERKKQRNGNPTSRRWFT